ncbi:MAG: hypothetical protein ACRDU5_05030 [Mycobacterium sp.]
MTALQPWAAPDDSDTSNDHEPITDPIAVGAYPPWYRTKRAVIALATVAVAAVACGVLLVLPSPGTDVEEATTVGPTAEPAPSSAQPSQARSPQPAVPSPPAAPPPPPVQPEPAPAGAREYREYPAPRPAAPSPTRKPEIGVTRTPATRAPISVAPEPRQAPENNSATPGDAPEDDGWGW